MGGPRRESSRERGKKRGRGTASRPSPRTLFSLSEEETYEFGSSLARQLQGGELIVLEGELGTGKTVFVRGLAAGLEIPPEDVWSPTFTLVHEYKGSRVSLFHVDLYRLSSAEEIATLGLEDLLGSGAIVAVEWGERLPPVYRRDALTVRIHDAGEGARRLELLVGAPAPRPPGDA